MLKFLTVLVACVLLAALAPLRASAQGEAAFSVDFSTLLWSGQVAPPELYYLDGAGQPQAVSLQSARRSRMFHYRGSGPLVFVCKERGAGGLEQLREVGRVELAADMPRVLVLFVTRAEGQGMNIVALDDGAENFPPGSYKLVNVTGTALDLHFGQRVVRLPAGSQQVYSPPERMESNAMDVAVSASGGRRALFAGSWPTLPALRTLVFFHSQGASIDNGVDAFIVSDVVAPAH